MMISMVMKIICSELNQSDFSGHIHNDGWFPIDEIDLVDGPAGLINACLAGSDKALVTGEMTCAVRILCDRCCEPVKLDLTAEFNYECIFGSEVVDEVRHETECREEDLNRIYVKEPVIDIGDLLREQLLLNIPPRILSGKSCQGLCQICGVDLKTVRFDCEQRQVDSQFAILRRLEDR